jgi:hypothetical protein
MYHRMLTPDVYVIAHESVSMLRHLEANPKRAIQVNWVTSSVMSSRWFLDFQAAKLTTCRSC